jgi:hypothetical protein
VACRRSSLAVRPCSSLASFAVKSVAFCEHHRGGPAYHRDLPEFFRTHIKGKCYLVVRDGLAWRPYYDASLSTYGAGSPGPPEGMSLDDWLAANEAEPLVTPELGPGEHYARMWRGGAWPNVQETPHSRQWRDSVRVTRMLARRLKAVFDDIEPIRADDNVYGHELRMLFLLACNEVESSCKAILTEHGVEPMSRGRFGMDDYRKLAPVMRLAEWEVTLSTNPDYGTVVPFAGWSAGPSASLPWYQAHHEVKHDREKMLDRATFGTTITAVCRCLHVARRPIRPVV